MAGGRRLVALGIAPTSMISNQRVVARRHEGSVAMVEAEAQIQGMVDLEYGRNA